MPIEIPDSGFNIHSATNTISGILSGNIERPEKVETVATTEAIPEAPKEVEPEVPKEVEPEAPKEIEPEVPKEVEPEVPKEVEPAAIPQSAPDDIEIDQSVLAEFLGVTEDDLVLSDEGVSIRAKVDGKVSEVSLKSLKDSYQLTNAAQQRMETLATERKEFETTRKTTLNELEQQQTFMGQAIQAMEQQYANDWKSTDWNRLREDDPETYTLKRQDHDDRAKQVEAFKQKLMQSYNQIQEEKQQNTSKAWEDGYRKLENAFTGTSYSSSPKWDDNERSKLTSWMASTGFTDEDMRSINSWQVFKWARDSMLREQEQKTAKEAVRRVVKLPKLKVTKPGSKPSKAAPRRTAIDDAKTKQRKAAKMGGRSNLKETVSLIEAMLKKG